MSRRKARESALQMLFQLDIGQNPWSAAEETLSGAELQPQNADFARQMVKGAWENVEHIDGLINKYLQEWQMDRLANVDKTILRLAVYELEHMQETPAKIVINEAIELAKVFGNEESAGFVNGILDSVYNQEFRGPEGEEEA